MKARALLILLCLLSWTVASPAQTPRDPDEEAPEVSKEPLPPPGREDLEALAKLRTRAELSGFQATGSYEETIDFLRKLQPHFPQMYLGFYGSSGEGRPLPFVVVSKEKVFTGRRAQQLPKPIVLIQNGIHAGEIDGKDASLILLRELAEGKHREIVDGVTLVVLPIYNVDGHEQVSPYNRPNQDGPRAGMGFRTTTNGLDLNRDYLKLASEEARALVALITSWRPHLFVDNHVTDGVDHDWTLTWSWAEAPQLAAPVDAWVREHLPRALAATDKDGFRTGPYVDLKDRNDPAQGFSSWVGQPRFSSGYLPLLNRPGILIETHSYKPYEQRVLATRSFLLGLLAEVARDPEELREAVERAEEAEVALGKPGAKPSEIALVYEESPEADRIRFPVYAHEMKTSAVTGQPLLMYRRGEVREAEVPWYHRSRIAKSLPRPRGYLLLPGWPQIEQRLRGHGLRVERLTTPATLDVEGYRVAKPKPAESSYQGLTRVTADITRAPETRTFPAGALWVPADQPDFEVAVQLLEPEAVDSLLSWGLLSTVFEQKEYMEPRVLEAWVAEALKDPQTAAAWREALKDEKLAADPMARYQWWSRRTPYQDRTVGFLPVFRAMRAPVLQTRPWH